MPDDGVIQLRRNHSKQMLARTHMARHGKSTKTTNSRQGKITSTNPNGTTRKTHGLNHSFSGSSLNRTASNGNFQDGGDVITNHSPRNNGYSHRLHRSGNSKVSLGVGSSAAFGSHRHRGLSSGLGNITQPHRKPIIQLERDDDDGETDDYNESDPDGAEFEDFEEEDNNIQTRQRPPPPDRSDSQLSIGIQPVEPTPPKLSEETVISVSSVADMASALKGARDKSGFVDNDDLISTAVNRSKNLGNMAQMVRGWNSSRQHNTGNLKGKASGYAAEARGSISSIPGGEDPREYEKVFREYTNTRAICNPVLSSLCRVLAVHQSDESSSPGAIPSNGRDNNTGSKLHLPTMKKVNSLVATTANQMSNYTDRGVNDFLPEHYSNSQSHGAIESASAYTLNKIWQTGWEDTGSISMQQGAAKQLPLGIQNQAMKVQRQLNNARDKQHRERAR